MSTIGGSLAERRAAMREAPAKTGTFAVTQVSVGTTTTNVSPGVTQRFVGVQALTADAYIRFKETADTANVTSSNGYLIRAGYTETFWVSTNVVFEVVQTASGNIAWWVASKGTDG